MWKKSFDYIKKMYFTGTLLFVAAFPASTNFQLRSYEFGGGGQGFSNSANYSLQGQIGELSDDKQGSRSGLAMVEMANTPIVPIFRNSANWYNKLQFILNTSHNPSDTVFAIAISTDGFTTTQYVQSDNTIGPSLGVEDFQTYTAWGGSSGAYIIGLSKNTTYQIKVKARQGSYSESPWGPVATAATSDVTLSFDIDVAPTDQSTNPPYIVSLGTLTPGSVTTASDKVWVSLDTNAESGGSVYVYDQYSGLKSSSINHTISAVSTDLSSASEGFGLQVNSTAQSTGGPFTAQSPFDGNAENVGLVNTTVQVILSSIGPMTSGRASMYVKAKASSITPAAIDYSDILTLIASASF